MAFMVADSVLWAIEPPHGTLRYSSRDGSVEARMQVLRHRTGSGSSCHLAAPRSALAQFAPTLCSAAVDFSSAEGIIGAQNVVNAIAYMYIDAEKAVCVRIGGDARTVPQAAPRCELTVPLPAECVVPG